MGVETIALPRLFMEEGWEKIFEPTKGEDDSDRKPVGFAVEQGVHERYEGENVARGCAGGASPRGGIRNKVVSAGGHRRNEWGKRESVVGST